MRAESSCLQLAARMAPSAQLRATTGDCIYGKRALSRRNRSDQHVALAFCAALVQQPLAPGSIFASSLLSFATVRSLKRQGAWRLPTDYSRLLKRLRYGLRLTLLGASRSDWLHANDDGPRASDEAALAATAALQQLRDQWLCCNSTPPTFGSALSLIFLYVKLVARHSLRQGPAVWERAL